MPHSHADPEKAEVQGVSTGYEKSHVIVMLSMAANGQECVQTFLSSLM